MFGNTFWDHMPPWQDRGRGRLGRWGCARHNGFWAQRKVFAAATAVAVIVAAAVVAGVVVAAAVAEATAVVATFESSQLSL